MIINGGIVFWMLLFQGVGNILGLVDEAPQREGNREPDLFNVRIRGSVRKSARESPESVPDIVWGPQCRCIFLSSTCTTSLDQCNLPENLEVLLPLAGYKQCAASDCRCDDSGVSNSWGFCVQAQQYMRVVCAFCNSRSQACMKRIRIINGSSNELRIVDDSIASDGEPAGPLVEFSGTGCSMKPKEKIAWHDEALRNHALTDEDVRLDEAHRGSRALPHMQDGRFGRPIRFAPSNDTPEHKVRTSENSDESFAVMCFLAFTCTILVASSISLRRQQSAQLERTMRRFGVADSSNEAVAVVHGNRPRERTIPGTDVDGHVGGMGGTIELAVMGESTSCGQKME